MYSLMNVGKNYFCHLHAEQMITASKEQDYGQNESGLVVGTIKSSVITSILDESFKRVRLFIETSGITSVDNEVLDSLVAAIRIMLEKENEVFFLGSSEKIGNILEDSFTKAGFELWQQNNQHGYWYLEVRTAQRTSPGLSVERCEALVREIHDDNLRILVEDGPKGKAMDVRRLLEDEEDCVYYYCYRLALRMVEEELVHPKQSQNQDICLIPGNDAGYYIARELSLILGTQVCTESMLRERQNVLNKYIIVRDVIHMFCELNGLTSMIEACGNTVCGSACMIDVNTGVGSRRNRASVYTIDLEKGISYRLRMKKEMEEHK